jgi:hypothetical protein
VGGVPPAAARLFCCPLAHPTPDTRPDPPVERVPTKNMDRQEVPYTHRHHSIMLVSQRMERNLGRQTFEEVGQLADSHAVSAVCQQGAGRVTDGWFGQLPAAKTPCCYTQPTPLQVTQQAAAGHALLPPQHPAVSLVKRVGMRIAAVRHLLSRLGLPRHAGC